MSVPSIPVAVLGPHHQPPNGTSKSPRLTVNVGDLIDSRKQTVNARERAENIPNEISVFTKVNGASSWPNTTEVGVHKPNKQASLEP